MAIYRGPGGSGDAVNDASSETRLAVEARDAAIAAKVAAETAQAAAELAETHAETAETNAETAETNAETAATNAASSASSASTSATSASNSASAASTSATNAASSASSASSSASAASTSATNAATSATNASNSASAASTSATNASNSASAAASSASSASSSASTATTQASNASTSATNAASSASSASSSASTATTQAGIATTQATNASNSASAAATSATNASNSASAASTSASNAATSATAAQTAENNAETAQAAAESARDATLAAYDSFDDRYLGVKSSDPALDNDGNALAAGSLYFSSTDNAMKVYTGSAWVAAYVSGAGTLLAANNLSDVSSVSSSRTNLGVTATGADTTYAYRANNLSDLASASTARTNLGLGTAATTAATDYATAAQGAKADTALQPAAIGVSVQAYDADLAAFALKTAPTGAVVGTSDTQTLTNKTIALGSNTVSGTLAEFNTAVTDADFASIAGTETLTNKTLTSPALTSPSISSGNLSFGTTGQRITGDFSNATIANRVMFQTSTTNGNTVIHALPNGTGTSSQFSALNSSSDPANCSLTRIRTTSTDSLLEAERNGTGTYLPLSAIVGGSERLRIDTSGNVGVGTSSPTGKLTVNTSSASLVEQLTLNNPDVNGAGSKISFRQGANEFGTVTSKFVSGAWQLDFGTNSFDPTMTLKSGNVGIGTGSPTTRLHVDGTVQARVGATGIQIYGTGGSGEINSVGANPMLFNVNSTERMRIDSSGNLLVGNTSAIYNASNRTTLNVNGTNEALISLSRGNSTSTAGYLYHTTGEFRIFQVENSPMIFGTSNTERMRIASNGAVTIRNNIASNNALELGNTNTGTGTSFGVKFAGGTNASDYCISGDNAASTVNLFNFRGNGDFQFNSGYGSAATAYGCRAWVNFNGQGTVAIRASGNVSSITDLGTGYYTINMTNAMPDTNYAFTGTSRETVTNGVCVIVDAADLSARTTSSFRIQTIGSNSFGLYDSAYNNISVFR